MATITIPLDQVRKGDRVRAVAIDADVEVSGTVASDLSLRLAAPHGRVLLDLSTEGERARVAGLWSITVERDVLDLPTEPGVLFRATVRGVPSVLVMYSAVTAGDSTPYVTSPAVGRSQFHTAEHIDPETVELATITWGAGA